MKYELYRMLSPEQKEEWQFKFKKTDDLAYWLAPSLVPQGVLMLTIMTLFISVAFILLAHPDIAPFERSVAEMIAFTMKVAYFWVLIIIADICIGIGVRFVTKHKERKWLKTQGASS